MLPFGKIRYSFKIEDPQIPDEFIWQQVKALLAERHAKVVLSFSDELIYSGSTKDYPGRGDFAVSVEKGAFQIVYKEKERYLEYKIFPDNSIIYFIVFLFLGSLISGPIGPAFVMLFLVATLFFSYSTHEEFFSQIKRKVHSYRVGEASEKWVDSNYNKEVKLMTFGVLLIMLVLIIVCVYL